MFYTMISKKPLKLPLERMSYNPQSNKAEEKLSHEQISPSGTLAAHVCFFQANYSSDVISDMM